MAEAPPEGRCNKEGVGMEALGAFGASTKLWSRRYAKVVGPSLNFYGNEYDEDPANSSIVDVRGCSLALSTRDTGLFSTVDEYQIALYRQGQAAQGLPDLRGEDATTRFSFADEAERDRFADALANMSAARRWNEGEGTRALERAAATGGAGAVAPPPPRIAQTFALTAGGRGFGMNLSPEGVVIGYTDGPAELAGVPMGGTIVQVNRVAVRSLKQIKAQLHGLAGQSVEFFMLLKGEQAEAVRLLFELVDLDGDGMLSREEYASFVRHTERAELDDTRWAADTAALGSTVAGAESFEGLGFSAFVRMYTDTRFKHFGRAAKDKESLIWQPVAMQWMWEDAMSGLVGDHVWSRKLAKVDPFSNFWDKGDGAETAASLATAADNPVNAGRPVDLRRLMTDGIHRGRLTNVGLTSWTSAVKWFVLRDGLHPETYELCLFGAEGSAGEPEDTIQLTAQDCAVAGANPAEFTVCGFDRKWIKRTWTLKAESEAVYQSWLQAFDRLTFGANALQRTTSNTLHLPDPQSALAWLEAQHRGEPIKQLLVAIDARMEQKEYVHVGRLLRTLGSIAQTSGRSVELCLSKQDYEAKKTLVQQPLTSLLQDASALLEQELKRPYQEPSRESGRLTAQLARKLDGFQAITRSLSDAIPEDVQAQQQSQKEDIAAKLEQHFAQLVRAAMDATTTAKDKAQLLDRMHYVSALSKHFPDGSEDPGTRLAGVWTRVEGAAKTLFDQCMELTAEVIQPGGLQRSYSSQVEDGVDDLARKLGHLDEFRAAFAPVQSTAEEGVPPQPEPEPEPEPEHLQPEDNIAVEGDRAHMEQYHRTVCVYLTELRARLQVTCSTLRSNAQMVNFSPEECGKLDRTMETLIFYANAVDEFADGRFKRTHDELEQKAKTAIEQLLQQFDAAVGGEPAAVETAMNQMEDIGRVPCLKHLVEPHIQTMRGKMAGQVHNLEQKAMDLYTARNFAGLAQFLAELKSAPAQAAQST